MQDADSVKFSAGVILEKLQSGRSLSSQEAFEMQSSILQGDVPTPTLLEIFTALSGRKVTKEELGGFFKASQSAMTELAVTIPTLDTCGTGGDNSGSFNIS